MTTFNDTGTGPLIINELTKTQLESASSLSNTELYLVDPEFAGEKLLMTDTNGNIVESNLDPSSIGSVGNIDGGRADSIYLISQVIDGGTSSSS